MADVMAVQQNFAFLNIVKPAKDIDNRAFPRAGRPYQRNALARRNVQIQMLQNLNALFIGKRYILIIYLPGNRREIFGIRGSPLISISSSIVSKIRSR